MLDIYTVVHLHNGAIWTTLKTLPIDHDDLIGKFLVHLAYLGMGIFVELITCEKPLQVLSPEITGRSDVDSIVVGDLEIKQEHTGQHETSCHSNMTGMAKTHPVKECSVYLK